MFNVDEGRHGICRENENGILIESNVSFNSVRSFLILAIRFYRYCRYANSAVSLYLRNIYFSTEIFSTLN